MAGKAYIGGTAYDITGGKTLVGGTAYDITAGKTLIGGTAYDIVFKKPVTLRELFDDLTVVGIAGRNSSTSRLTYISTSITATSHACYLFSMFNGGISIWKITGALSSISTTPLKAGGSGYPGIYNYNSGSRIYYRTGTSSSRYSSGSSTSGGTSVYGCTLPIIRFPNYDNDVVESILSQMTITTEDGVNASSSSSNYFSFDATHNNDNFIYLVSVGTALDSWSYSGANLTRISGTSSQVATKSSTTRIDYSGHGITGLKLQYTSS